MKFRDYLLDKRYFAGFYVALMAFVSLVMLAGAESPHAADNVLYANAGGLLAAAAYVAIGYWYRSGYYRELERMIGGAADAAEADPPAPQTAAQRLQLALADKLRREHDAKLFRLAQERREQQDYILSWIHEIKLPIAASRLLIDNIGGKTVEELTDKWEDELAKIDHLVDQALYYSRIDSFASDYMIAELPLRRIAKESARKYAKLFIAGRIRLLLDETGGDPHVRSDGKWLAYIVDQLVVNALKYTAAGGTIAIRFEEDRVERRLLVRDDGVGIKPEDIGRVFDRGFTGSNGRQFAKSTGMGLYLANQLARKLGHELSIRSEEGVFTEAAVHFPKLSDAVRRR
ncbi:MAG: sensor histidine kinase [Paenibacillaceae bacterium]|nr:sensor histidine kinase [Paenibacillaceae bacterium]